MTENTEQKVETQTLPEYTNSKKINKFGLTAEQIEAMSVMTPKEKKVFLKPFRKGKR
jgi:hypothetical protein